MGHPLRAVQVQAYSLIKVFLGVASATQLSFHFAIGELVPMKYRYIAVGCLYPFTIVSSGFGPAVSYTFVSKYPGVGWRGTYWLLLAMNGTALLCWTLFYFPPTFEQKHEKDINDKVYWIKHFDYVGTFIFAASFVVFLMGFSWGGTYVSFSLLSTTCLCQPAYILGSRRPSSVPLP